MSRLTVYPDNDSARPQLDTTDSGQIAAALQVAQVRFERWEASRQLPLDADDRVVLEAYDHEIQRLKAQCGYQSVDVLRLLPDHPDRQTLRRKFLDEHTHDEDEVRFFVEGAGVFYLRTGGKVYMTLCERGDLLSVPAGTRHWFDMGPAPRFTAIRLFTTPQGWVARFTGDPIAQRFPRFETPLT
jgi:1,2-dihydroxy-3-keto-5-methylthiopentene dioxygenase